MVIPKIPTNSDGTKTMATMPTSEMRPIIRDILKHKTPNYTEVEVSFFQYCNLHCSFCWQDTYNTDGVESIPEKAQTVIDYLSNRKDELRPRVQIHLLGGEVFEDSNDFYEDYKVFVGQVSQWMKQNCPEKELVFIFISNMTFNKDSTYEKVDELIEWMTRHHVKFQFSTSWDPTGRPLSKDLNSNFHVNIHRYKSYIGEITFVLTRPTINRILRHENPYLDYLYDNFKLEYDDYTPTEQSAKLMPSDREILEALRCIRVKYPRISRMEHFLMDKPVKEMTCASINKVTILPDGTMVNCRHLNYDQSWFETEIITEDNSDMIWNFLTKKECLSCEFFQECPLSCFLLNDSKLFGAKKELPECLYKIFQRELKSNV